MVEVHQLVGALVVLVNLIAAVWGYAAWRGWNRPGVVYANVLAGSHTLAIGQALIGLYLLSQNLRAPVQLHYVYGLVPTALVLLGYSSRTEDSRRNLLVFSIIAGAIALIAARAFMTGMGWG